MNKRGTYGVIADDLRFDTQLSNVYGNAIRHARCQKLFLFPLSVAKQKKKAELFCKERLWVYNYVMQTTKIIQKSDLLMLGSWINNYAKNID